MKVVEKEESPDVLLYFGTMPPCIVPLSPRALTYMEMGEYRAVMFVDTQVEDILSYLPEDYTVGQATSPPENVTIRALELASLH